MTAIRGLSLYIPHIAIDSDSTNVNRLHGCVQCRDSSSICFVMLYKARVEFIIGSAVETSRDLLVSRVSATKEQLSMDHREKKEETRGVSGVGGATYRYSITCS